MTELLTKASPSDAVNERERRNLETAYKAACESIVLLKNDGALPIRPGKIALYGAGALRTVKGGTGSGDVNERHHVGIYEGLRDRGYKVTTKPWLVAYEKAYKKGEEEFIRNTKKEIWRHPTKMTDALLAAYPGAQAGPISDSDIKRSDTDTCIYVLSRQAGEGRDRRAEKGDLFVTDTEKASIKKCAESYSRFVLIVNCGSQMDMSFLDEINGIGAILYICQLGMQGGEAVADVVAGKVTPSGKLADTWAKTYSDIPFSEEYSYLNGNVEDEYYKEGIYVGYRYFDSFSVCPRYPFGYGLSYTDFEIRPEDVAADGGRISAHVSVANVGKEYAGKEVVQLYVSAPNGKLDKEYQSLAAFEKSGSLAPGESQKITLAFDMEQIASYRESDGCFVLEKGDYILRAGNSSRNTKPCGVVVLKEEVVVSRHQNICPQKQVFEELEAQGRAEEDCGGVKRIELDARAFQTVSYAYKTPGVCKDKRVREFVKKLSVMDMVEIVVGTGMFGSGARFTLPGSVGNTTSKFWEKGLANVALCDGPAGLRIQRRSAVTKEGKVKMIDSAFAAFKAMPGLLKRSAMGNPRKDKVIYQYTTAFPVSGALAQSWNRELLYEVGKAVYEEMKEYGCTFWLAPAVNIHRNPLCGRNFEYYSEDPFLTGEMAAAVTKGAQQEEGYYVTVKHFACNNQEDNRNRVSSNVSERALREIYLRGFERVVRKGGAKGVMTSYNRVNGVYAPNSYDLCTKVLRNEWGFDGVVMTDWFSTGKGLGDSALAMKAGNDLIMPGGSYYKKDIIRGLKDGTADKKDVRRCCANVVKAVFDSQIQKEYIK